MKTLLTLLSVSVLLSTAAIAETPLKTQAMEKIKNVNQNRFQTMSTDELLQHRGTLTSEQEREQLHNELKNREQKMTKAQKEQFNKRPPENRVRKMKNQGEGQGMMKGPGGGMGGGGGGR